MQKDRPSLEIARRALDDEPPAERAPTGAPVRPRAARRRPSDGFIGQFRIVRKLGEGGMGLVYEAEQQQPRRPVALKVVRGGQHVDPGTIRLFQREAQTLARLRHPGIAALYETGCTDDGLHFFAMELVRGQTLSAWLQHRPAGPTSPVELKLRLALFKKICDAVAYAHQKGVIHRDLKPSNILVLREPPGGSGPVEERIPDVKVLDFGLARITDSDVQMTTCFTEVGRVQGTLPYMSPEQVRGNPDEIDLRTDVYSLGVLLYEMVTGRLPYDVARSQLPEAVRIICEEPPRSISGSFTGSRRLDADVITIAGKALEKEPARRYQSAAALGEDVGRWLTDQPILARPPSTSYQLRKLMTRHKGPFAFAASIFVLLAAFAIVMTVQAARIAQERDRADEEAETARQVSDFLEGLFKVSDPSESRGSSITAREILDSGAARIERELRHRPLAQARFMGIIARVYYHLGLMTRARPLGESALRLYERHDGTNSLRAADEWNFLGVIDWTLGAHGRALLEHERALAIRQRVLPPGDPALARAVHFVGSGQMYAGRWQDAEATLRRAALLADAHGESTTIVRKAIRDDMGYLMLGTGRYAEAERWYREGLEISSRELGPDHRQTTNSLNNVGFILGLQGRAGEGRPFLERALAAKEQLLGPDHPDTANVLHSLGELERQAGMLERARLLLERALRITEASSDGSGEGLTAMVLTSLAPVLAAEGRLAEAEAAYRRALALHERAGGSASKETATSLEGLGAVVRRQGRLAEADGIEARARELRAAAGAGVGIAFQSGHGYWVDTF